MTLSGITYMFSSTLQKPCAVKNHMLWKNTPCEGSIIIVCNLVKCGGKPHELRQSPQELCAVFHRAVNKRTVWRGYLWLWNNPSDGVFFHCMVEHRTIFLRRLSKFVRFSIALDQITYNYTGTIHTARFSLPMAAAESFKTWCHFISCLTLCCMSSFFVVFWDIA